MSNMQLFLNNFGSLFVASVKDAPTTGTPATELDYGILRLSDGAAGALINPTSGDYYVLTAFKKFGTTESNIEIMRVTNVDNSTPGECRVTVLRGQEGTAVQGYIAGDYVSMRWTKGGVASMLQTAANLSDLSNAATSRTNLGLGNVDNTSDANKPVSAAQAAAIGAKAALNNVAPDTHAAANKPTPVDADELPLVDSANSFSLRRLTLANLKAFLKTYLDTLYPSKTSDTGSVQLPSGTSAQRDGSPTFGATRANSTLTQTEWWNGTAWVSMGGGATGAPGNAVFVENDQAVTADYTLTAGKNAMSAGNITINTGVLVSVPTGAFWSIV